MAANDRRRRAYGSTPGKVVDGNLARRLERELERSGQMAPDEYYVRRKESRADKLSQRRKEVKASIRPAQKLEPAAVIGFGVVGVLLTLLVLCYVRLNAISREIVDMKTQIGQLETERVSLLTRYEQAFDLATVKTAAEAAGMSQPSDSQITYIELPGQDNAVAYSEPEEGLLEVLTGALREGASVLTAYFR
ncbi:MAG: hypothetical protein HFF77_08660 [Oscillospiraceae bacterium]|jgi:hypothetical protein|nr:hypothetical protein [Oscillospiraceae bacterium]